MAQFGFTAGKAAPITTNVAFNRCYALLCDAAVTTTSITMADGTVVTGIPLQAGYNPISCTKVVFGSGNIWALYEVP